MFQVVRTISSTAVCIWWLKTSFFKVNEESLCYPVFSAVPSYIQRQWAHCKEGPQKKAAIISPKAYLAGKWWNKMKLQIGWSRGTRSSGKENLKAEMSFMCEASGIFSLCMVHSIFSLFPLWKDIQVGHLFPFGSALSLQTHWNVAENYAIYNCNSRGLRLIPFFSTEIV